jgi:hypothetical protein
MRGACICAHRTSIACVQTSCGGCYRERGYLKAIDKLIRTFEAASGRSIVGLVTPSRTICAYTPAVRCRKATRFTRHAGMRAERMRSGRARRFFVRANTSSRNRVPALASTIRSARVAQANLLKVVSRLKCACHAPVTRSAAARAVSVVKLPASAAQKCSTRVAKHGRDTEHIAVPQGIPIKTA